MEVNDQLSHLVELGIIQKEEAEDGVWAFIETDAKEISLDTIQALVEEFDGQDADVVRNESGLDLQILLEEDSSEEDLQEEESEEGNDSGDDGETTYTCEDCGSEYDHPSQVRWCDCQDDYEDDEEDLPEEESDAEESGMSETSKKSRTGSGEEENEDGAGEDSSQVREQSEDHGWGNPDLYGRETVMGLDSCVRFECGICGDIFQEKDDADEHGEEYHSGNESWNVWKPESKKAEAMT